jgi:guanylate kinase
MTENKQKQIVILAGPTGSGKDTIADEIIKKCSNCVLLTTATTRKMRPGEVDGVSYHFLTKEKFLEELENGNIPEHQYREGTDTYYGTYLPDLSMKMNNGSVVIGNVQIIGARYLKKHMNAITIFLHPKPKGILEARIRERDPNISDLEVNERLDIAITEIKVHAPWYDYTVDNIDGKLDDAVDDVIKILQKEDLKLNN